MVAPLLAGALIGGGASLLGGIFGRKSQSSANAKNAALQREFAQNTIQWRVKDAQAAGISPLAALGASTTSAAPSYVGADPGAGITRAGARIGQALSNQGQNQANILNTQASTDLIQQQILASKQAMAIEAANRTQDGQDVNLVPDLVTRARPGDPSVSAGMGHPGWKNVDVGGGLGRLDIPGDELNEVLEAPAAWPLVYLANKNKINKWIMSGAWRKWQSGAGRPSKAVHSFAMWVAKKLGQRQSTATTRKVIPRTYGAMP